MEFKSAGAGTVALQTVIRPQVAIFVLIAGMDFEKILTGVFVEALIELR
jgi:hypothetical protein